jgi:hypothetical protein
MSASMRWSLGGRMALVVASLWFLLGAGGMRAAAAELAVRQDAHGVTVEVDRGGFAAYVVDESNKPYLWPVVGPTGKAMTRAYPMQDVPSEPKPQRDHPHHRGITFGHESVGTAAWKAAGPTSREGGGDSWHDRLTFELPMAAGKAGPQADAKLAALARIVHREFTRVTTEGDRVVIEEACDHVDAVGKPFLVERRRLVFGLGAGTRWIDIDQEFRLADPERSVTFDDRKDAGLFIRVPTSMAVDSRQGGRIENSDGLIDAAAWSQPARWCDYSGPVEGERLGIAILNHPESFRHPTRWHVRTYGLFAANPFASRGYDAALPEASTTLSGAETVRLHHRFLFHACPAKDVIEAAYADYAKTSRMTWP